MVKLTKIYSREKTLFYFAMWNDSDRKGYLDFLDHIVKNNLFIVNPIGAKGSVWYDSNELAEIEGKIKERVSAQSFVTSLKERLDEEWKILLLYFSKQKVLSSGEDLRCYYTHLVSWWSAMNTVFCIPDILEVDEETKKLFLSYRTKSEKYTEQMNRIFIQFWNDKFPEYSAVGPFVLPSEAIEIANGDLNLIKEISKRKNGCILLNGEFYLLDQLNSMLEKKDLTLEKFQTENVSEIKGFVAYKAELVVIGKARVISKLKDEQNLQKGEILVTEMTNPDNISIMKLASAIVTNEGGVTCHAAITSRELRIPCIVGAKIATIVIKTGDMLEIDTEKGTIKVL